MKSPWEKDKEEKKRKKKAKEKHLSPYVTLPLCPSVC